MPLTQRAVVIATGLCTPAPLLAQTAERAADTGVSAVWIFVNLCYAGMRAQNSANALGRVLLFLLGFPGTLLTWLLVQEGSERAYGVDLPRATRPDR
jgi:uncharacterized membrane protein YhaH (DUF805 family)